jgi:gamma-glutamylaminecyclotransferase
MSTLVFVFGTLKEGFPNFATNRGKRRPGTFVTTQRFPLYMVGARFVPWMVNLPGEGHQVAGQLFEVDDATLAAMDLLEGVDEPDGYQRMEIEVALNAQGATSRLVAFGYMKPPEQLAGAAIASGQLREYTLADAALYRHRP